MKHVVITALVLGSALVATTASADEKQVITIKPTNVYGRAPRPSVAIEISRARMNLPATTPTLAAGMKIQDASKKDSL